MKNVKTILCLISLLVAGITNVWGAGEYTWNSTDKILTIHKAGALETGVMPDYDETSLGNKTPWTSYLASVTDVIVDEDISYIGKHAFYGASKLKSIQLPSTIQSTHANVFKGSQCTSLTTIYYAGTPNDWAKIDFGGSMGHPFNAITKGNGRLFFYGRKTGKCDSILVISPTITEIKPFAFYKAKITELSIPGTIETIGNYAFDCGITSNLAINRVTPPTTGTNSITFKSDGTTYLYIPAGAESGYNSTPWYDSTNKGNGAKNIGNSSDHSNTKVTESGKIKSKVSGPCGTNVTWTLTEDGTLTFAGHGATNDYTSASSANSETVVPWCRFRRLVYKVIIEDDGSDITALGSCIMQYFWGLHEVEIRQATIPTTASIGYANLFNSNDQLSLKISQASLTDATASRLASEPWSNSRMTISLSEPALFDQNIDNSAWLTAADTYLDIKTFDLQLRSLSNSYNNTFCSPVTLTKAQVKEIWGDDTEVAAMTGTSINEDGEIELTFAEIRENDLEAGTPYLVWPENNVDSPVIENVNLGDITTTGETVNTDYMAFTGILAPKAITEDEVNNQSIIFLTTQFNGDHQILTWANGGTLNGQRAYWQFKESTPASAMARRPILKFSDETNTATGIDPVTENPSPVTLKQLRDGQLIIIKNGKTYNAQGAYLR